VLFGLCVGASEWFEGVRRECGGASSGAWHSQQGREGPKTPQSTLPNLGKIGSVLLVFGSMLPGRSCSKHSSKPGSLLLVFGSTLPGRSRSKHGFGSKSGEDIPITLVKSDPS
jgi:hypothetical protein